MMSKYLRLFLVVIAIIGMVAAGSTALADTTLASTFTYQGFLSNNGTPVTDSCEFQFGLFSVVSGPGQIGSTLTRTAGVSGGVFTVQLDFGAAAFDANDRYLDIQVRCPAGSGSYIQLTPRSPITSAPSALFAANAAQADNATNSTNSTNATNATNAATAAVADGLTALTIQLNATSPNLIGGFTGNTATSGVFGAAISGGGETGLTNRVTDNYGNIGGGRDNLSGNNDATLTNAIFATVGGGQSNTAGASWAVVAGGVTNLAVGPASFVGGGENNQANSQYAVVAGGTANTANNQYSTVPGGRGNTAGGDYSFAAGRRAKANAVGSFVWADSTDADMVNSTVNSFVVRATGGFAFYTDAAGLEGATMPPGGGGWSILSDRNVKNNFESVDPRIILDDLASMPISTWNYNAQDTSIRHIGPMAQDFYATFGVGEDNRHISTVDSSGVALAAIQGLYQVVQDKDAQIATLQTENAELKTRLDDLDQRLSALEALAAPSQAGASLPVMLMGVVLLGGLGVAGRRMLRKDAAL